MTAPKRPISTLRPPSYVCRLTGSAELEISADTWDAWVKEGRLPAAAPGFPETAPRWRWVDIDRRLAGKTAEDDDPIMRAIDTFGNGQTKNARQQ